MTATSDAALLAVGRPGRGRAVALVVAVAVVLVVLGARAGTDSRPYALDDAGENGYVGLVRTLEKFGSTFTTIDAADVNAGLNSRADTLFVPEASGASTAQFATWKAFARRGGIVVLGGRPSGEVTPSSGSLGFPLGVAQVGQEPGTCTIDVLADLKRIDPGGSARLEVGPEEPSCYGDRSTAFVVRDGGVFIVAGPRLFTNETMRPKNQEVDDPTGPMEDNVVLAQRLLAPQGRARIAVVTSGISAAVPQAGNRSVFSQMSVGVKLGLWELVIAAVLLCVVLARRLGRVVVEPQPVPIAGSELVEAVGNLMERRRDPSHAAALIRADMVDRLARRLGMGTGVPATLLAPVVAARTGREPDAVLALLAHSTISSDAQLVELSRQLDQLRQEILGE